MSSETRRRAAARYARGALALLCAGCVTTPPIAFDADERLQVAIIQRGSETKRFVLEPTDPRHARLVKWLVDHPSGWSPYPATTPGYGTLISGANLSLQFLGTSVLACRPKEGCLQRSTRAPEDAFVL
jgi:hypothetical protein